MFYISSADNVILDLADTEIQMDYLLTKNEKSFLLYTW